MPNRKPRTPLYRHHKASGQAVVTLNGRDFYLGKYRTEASRVEYDRHVSEWLTHGRRLPSAPDGAPDLTVGPEPEWSRDFEKQYASLRKATAKAPEDAPPTDEDS